MEVVAKNYQLNMTGFNLGIFNQGGEFSGGMNNNPDSAAYYYYQGFAVGLYGDNFTFQDAEHGNYTPTAGTVTGINFADYTNGNNASSPDLAIDGFSISVADLFQIVQTSTPADDSKLLATFLKGDDMIDGAQFNDTLLGLGGNDKIHGNLGSDKISGGKGKDKLYAGKDDVKDTFFFDKGDSSKHSDSADKVFQFHSGEDKINLKALDITKSDIDLSVDHGDTFASIDYKGSHKADMVIQIMNVDDLHKGDFVV